MLYQSDELLLSLIVLVFTVVFPLFKKVIFIIEIYSIKINADGKSIHQIIGQMSRWSMLDVLIIAMTIVALKSSGVANALSNIGLYFFVISIILSGILSRLIIARNCKGFY